MKIKSTIVIAAAAGSALAPVATQAEPVRAKPVMASSWTGWYAGVHLGAAWQNVSATGTYIDSGVVGAISNSANRVGFIGGGQIGYNWQSGSMVYGWEADVSGLSGTASASQTIPLNSTLVTSSGGISWLATFRGRLGTTVTPDTLLYATGGLAVGGVRNTLSETGDLGGTATFTDNSTRAGYAVGGGIEHMLNAKWTVRAEAIYVDLGKRTESSFTGTCGGGIGVCNPIEFKNNATILRAAANFRF